MTSFPQLPPLGNLFTTGNSLTPTTQQVSTVAPSEASSSDNFTVASMDQIVAQETNLSPVSAPTPAPTPAPANPIDDPYFPQEERDAINKRLKDLGIDTSKPPIATNVVDGYFNGQKWQTVTYSKPPNNIVVTLPMTDGSSLPDPDRNKDKLPLPNVDPYKATIWNQNTGDRWDIDSSGKETYTPAPKPAPKGPTMEIKPGDLGSVEG